MKFKCAADVLQAAKERGLEVWINHGPPPMPMLRYHGDRGKALATDALLGALRAWRLEIIELLTRPAGEPDPLDVPFDDGTTPRQRQASKQE